jgi:transcription antitermination factor NusG
MSQDQLKPMEPLVPMSFPLGCAWYVASARQHSEFTAEEDIKDLGFDAYVPRCRRFRTVSRRHTGIQEWPLFTGYVFVAFDIERDFGCWQKIRDVDGISEILSNNNIPMRVKAADLDRLRRSQDAGAFDFTIPATTFKVGEDYRIAEGPFSTFLARFRAASSKKRAKIAIEFFGGWVEAEIDVSFLAQIG